MRETTCGLWKERIKYYKCYDKLKKEYSHEIIGALGNGVAVCEGIAKAVKCLCDELGIWCIIALSENNPDKGIKYRHAWNVMKIDGKYYHFDATFDNTLSKDDVIRYDYVNLSDKQIFRDHEPVIWKVPACDDNDHFYYKEKKISWTTMDEVRNRTKQAVKKGKVLLFHWRGGYLTREILQKLLVIFDEEAKAKDKHSYVSVNCPEPVFEGYCPIVDWYYDSYVMNEEVNTPLEEMYLPEEFSDEEWAQMKEDYAQLKNQYQADKPNLVEIKVKDALTEMKQMQKLFK